MAKVVGLGGIFFRAADPKALDAWYAQHLGLKINPWGGARFREGEAPAGYTLWTPFAADTEYFGSSQQAFMLNFQVDDLDALLAQLRADGVAVDERVDDSEFGRFGWITDPEGHRVELWQPPAAKAADK